jgi:esterase/lipase superfamily enzyme/CheY-like chemotaxis protein
MDQPFEGRRATLDLRDVLDTLWLASWLSPSREEEASARTPVTAGSSTAPPKGASLSEEAVGSVEKTAETTAIPATASVKPTDTARSTGSLYARGSDTSKIGDTPIRVRPIRIPAGSALPNSLPIVRALRVLPTRLRSRVTLEIDEDATVEASTQGWGIVPVLKPRLERGFEAALVVEHTPSAEMWAQTIVEIERMLACSGIFRDVRTWRLERTPAWRLFNESGGARRPEILRDPTSRRIVFLFSAGVSDAWADGSFDSLLASWGASTPVALLHPLPRRLWKGTALGEPSAFAANPTPGGPNTGLKHKPAWWARPLSGERVALPVLALDPASARRWAEMFAARRGRRAPAFLLARTSTEPAVYGPPRARPLPPVAERVELLRANAPQAFRLAVRLCMGPFTMPILHLLQASLFGREAEHAQIAEVMLSGLVTRVTPVDAGAPPEQVQFEFLPEAAALLRTSLRRDDARQVTALLRGYIEQQFGAPKDQVVLLDDPRGPLLVPAGARPFAELNEQFVRWLEQRIGTPGPTLRDSQVEVEPEPFQEAAQEPAPAVSATTPRWTIDPARTVVVAVGVSSYDIGPEWTLPHAAQQAAQFADWAVRRGVPLDRVHLFVSTADQGGLARYWQQHCRPATRLEFAQFVSSGLAAHEGDLLYVFWAGRGAQSTGDSRIAFFEDVDRVSTAALNLTDFFAFLRTTLSPRFARQIAFVDVSATAAGDLDLEVVPSTAAANDLVMHEGVHQSLLFGGSSDRTGVFGDAVLLNLDRATYDGAWPADQDWIAAAITTYHPPLHPQRTEWRSEAAPRGAAAEKTDAAEADGPQRVTTLYRTFAELPRTDRPYLTGIRILWVDDFPRNNDIERRILTNLGATCDDVTSTERALEAIARESYDIVLSDLGRAEGTDAGVDLLQTLHERGVERPFIIYATRAAQLRERATKAGAFGITNDSAELFALVVEATEQLRRNKFANQFSAALNDAIRLQTNSSQLWSTTPAGTAQRVALLFEREPEARASGVVTLIAALSGGRSVQLFRADAAGPRLVAQRIADPSARASTQTSGLVGEAIRRLEPILVVDMSIHRQKDEGHTGSELVIPIIEGARAALAISIEHDAVHAWSTRQATWLIEFVRALPLSAFAPPPAEAVDSRPGSVADEATVRRRFAYWFYVGCARPDLDPELSRFVNELDLEVRSVTGDTEPAGFIYSNDDDVASMTDEPILNSRVLLAIVTPEYVQNERCGREWQAFRLLQQTSLGRTGGILPVMWRPASEDLPRAVAETQLADSTLPDSYLKEGLASLATERSSRPDYRRTVQALAQAIVRLGTPLEPPDLTSLPDIDSLPNAFDDPRKRPPGRPAEQRSIQRTRGTEQGVAAGAPEGGRETPQGAAEQGAVVGNVVTVLVVTTRESANVDRPEGPYTSKRGKLTTLSAEVSVPQTHRLGEVEAPSLVRLQIRENPDRHVVVRSVAFKPEDFARGADEASRERDTLFYVPGFNVDFDDSLRRAAVLAFDLGWAGAVTLFDWPSAGSVLGYATDIHNAEWASTLFGAMMKGYGSPGRSRRHVIARDVGCRLVLAAAPPPGSIDQLILVQPELSAELMLNLMKTLAGSFVRTTIYVTPGNAALRAMTAVTGSQAFGSLTNATLPDVTNVDVIDVPDTTSPFSSPALWEDIFRVIRGIPAPDRFRLRRREGGWILDR